MLRILTSFAAVGAMLPAAEAIIVAPNSPCSVNCGNVLDATTPADVVCKPDEYTGGYDNGAGTVFQGCVQCELNSGYATDGNYTDNMAALCMYLVPPPMYPWPQIIYISIQCRVESGKQKF